MFIFWVGGVAMYFLLKAITDSSGNEYKKNALLSENGKHQWHSLNRYVMKVIV